MFGIGGATRIYLAAGATDMRKAFEALYGMGRDRLLCDPLSGHIFLFAKAQRNRLKLLFWDGSGLWVCAKRLEKGRLRWPETTGGETKVVLSHEELALLLGGIDLTDTQRRQWYRREVNPVRLPPQSGWLDELGRLKGGRAIGLGVARCAPIA